MYCNSGFCKKSQFSYFIQMNRGISYVVETYRDRQGQIWTDKDRQGQTRKIRERHGQTDTERDRQRQTGKERVCPYLSLFVPALSLFLPALLLLVPTLSLRYPCLSLLVPVLSLTLTCIIGKLPFILFSVAILFYRQGGPATWKSLRPKLVLLEGILNENHQSQGVYLKQFKYVTINYVLLTNVEVKQQDLAIC